MGRVFHLIGVVLATYSLSWEKGHGPVASVINSGRFLLSPEQRAKRIIQVRKLFSQPVALLFCICVFLQVTREADIAFCKGFWNLAELGNVRLSTCFGPMLRQLF